MTLPGLLDLNQLTLMNSLKACGVSRGVYSVTMVKDAPFLHPTPFTFCAIPLVPPHMPVFGGNQIQNTHPECNHMGKSLRPSPLQREQTNCLLYRV